MSLLIKRVYDDPSPADGKRILVDRLWPRGMKKSRSKIDLWLKDIAPSAELRRWFNHDPDKWVEFKKRYFSELSAKEDILGELIQMANNNTVTLLFAAKNEKINNAVAITEYLHELDSLRAHSSTNTSK